MNEVKGVKNVVKTQQLKLGQLTMKSNKFVRVLGRWFEWDVIVSYLYNNENSIFHCLLNELYLDNYVDRVITLCDKIFI